jgi:DNA-binding transcriptional MerR regulator
MLTMSLPAGIPVKIYYSIREVSDYTGVEPHVLRYWETKFSKLRPKRVGGNQRKYTRADLELIMEIIRLLYREGYTLDGAEKRLRTTPKASVSGEAAADQGLIDVKRGLEQILALVS